jgi:hypothetical protein
MNTPQFIAWKRWEDLKTQQEKQELEEGSGAQLQAEVDEAEDAWRAEADKMEKRVASTASSAASRAASAEQPDDTFAGAVKHILEEEIEANPKVEEILAKAAKEKKSLMDLMFTVHVQESLSAVLAAIGTGEGTVHMSKDQHDRWKKVAADKNYTAVKIQPLGEYSERPNTAFDQLLTIAKTDLKGKNYDENEYKNVHTALQQLNDSGEVY